MLWSIVSKAADKRKRASRERLPLSIERRRSLTVFRSAVSVLCPGYKQTASNCIGCCREMLES